MKANVESQQNLGRNQDHQRFNDQDSSSFIKKKRFELYQSAPSQSIQLWRPDQPDDGESPVPESMPPTLRHLDHSFKDLTIQDQLLALQRFNKQPYTCVLSPSSEVLHILPNTQKSSGSRRPNFFNLIKIRSITRSFIRRLAIRAYIFKSLTTNQIIIVDKILNMNLSGIEVVKIKLKSLPVFEIQSWFTFVWDILQGILILLSFIWYPLQISFSLDEVRQFQPVEYSIIIFIMCDMLISLNRAKIQRGLVIRDRIHIFQIYADQMLLLDSIALLSLIIKYMIGIKWSSSILTACFIFSKFTRVKQISENLMEFYDLNGNIRDILSLIAMLLTVFFIVHFIACIWHGVAIYSNLHQNWLIYYGFESSPFLYKYQASFYWAAMTMTTVGYGDITPKNQIEYFVANVTMLVACIVFGYTINRVGMLINNMNQRKAEFKKNIALLNSYMNKHKVDFELQSRVRSYLDYIWQLENDQSDQEIDQIIKKLSNSLQEEVRFQVKGKLLNKCKVFEQFSQSFLKKAAQMITEVRFAPDENIKEKDNSLYLIQKGDIRLQPFGINLSFKIHEFIGEVPFFTNQFDSFQIVSKDFTQLLRVQRDKFLSILNQYPQDKEQFFQIKESLLFNQERAQIKSKCPCCTQEGHQVGQCNLVMYQPDRERVIKQFVYPTQQDREQFKRLRAFRHRTLCLHQITNKILKNMMLKVIEEENKSSMLEHSQSIPPFEEADPISGYTVSHRSIGVPSKHKHELQKEISIDETTQDQFKDKNDEFQSIFRKNERKKQSYQTAGFGKVSFKQNEKTGLTESVSNPMHLIAEKDSEQSSSRSKNSIDQTVLTLDKEKEKALRGRQKIMTSQYLQRQEVSISDSNVFNPSRSMTITPHSPRAQITVQKSLTNRFTMTSKREGKRHLSNVAPTMLQSDEHKATIMSNTAGRTNPSRLSMYEFYTPNQYQFGIQGFEKMQTFLYYFPEGNANFVIRRANRALKNNNKTLSLYSFQLVAMKRAQKICKYLLSRASYTQPDRRQSARHSKNLAL